MSLVKVVVLDDLHDVVRSNLTAELGKGLDITVHRLRAGNEEALIDRVADAEVVATIRARSTLTRTVIESLTRCRLISQLGGKTDHIDLDAATARGIPVVYTPNCGDQAVAEFVMASIYAHLRSIPGHAAEMRAGRWLPSVGREARGRTLGLVGFGPIARRLSEIATACGMRVIAWSPTLHRERAASAGAEAVSFAHCLESSDVVSLHVPGGASTRALIGEAELAAMKPSAVLVNTSRGSVVDEEALLNALRGQRLGGAVLDVFDDEPVHPDNPLLKLPSVIAAPHVAWSTEETYAAFVHEGFTNIQEFLRGSARHIVNSEVLGPS